MGSSSLDFATVDTARILDECTTIADDIAAMVILVLEVERMDMAWNISEDGQANVALGPRRQLTIH